MNRRDFIRVLGTIGAVATLPSDAIANVKTYPKIKYEVNYRPDMLSHYHMVFGDTDNERWVVVEMTEHEVLPDDMFLGMIDKLNDKIMVK